MLVQRVLDTINKVAPVKTEGTVNKQNSKPWLTSGIMTRIKHKRKLYRDALVNPDLLDSNILYRNNLNKPSQHVQLGHRWGPDGLSLGPQVGSPLGAQLTLATVFKWVPSGLPIWASPSGAQLGPTEIFILACI